MKKLIASLIGLMVGMQATYAITIIEHDRDYVLKTGQALRIVDHEVANSVFDPENGGEAEISFTINTGAKVKVDILEGDKSVIKTLIDRYYEQEGEYSVDWNGRDRYGDIVEDGRYFYRINAESGSQFKTVTGEVFVKRGFEDKTSDTEAPRLKRVFVTKEQFDPNFKERNYIVFTLTARADVEGEIYDNFGKKIYRFIDRDDLSAGTHSVLLDYDELAKAGRMISYRLYASNSKGTNLHTGDILIEEEDENNSKKPNIFKDYSDGIPFTPGSDQLEINFNLDRSAEVTVEIKDGDFIVKTLVDKFELAKGPHTVYWNGRDEFGEMVEDGIYQYKITAGNFQGRDVERGNFSVETGAGQLFIGNNCAGFHDVGENHSYCEAIKWAKGNKIISGFNDGSFKPDQPITRVQALKIIIEALNITIVENNGHHLGFSDAYKYDWYANYLRTALSLGVVKGYADGTFRPNIYVIRAEALVMVLNAAEAIGSVVVPTSNYGQPFFDIPNTPATMWYISQAWFAQQYDLTDNEHFFYPTDYMTRGEMVDMLYRYKQTFR